MLIEKAETGKAGASGDLMDVYEESLDGANYQTALPKAHVFSLTPVGPQE